jgi:hypothetical protein
MQTHCVHRHVFTFKHYINYTTLLLTIIIIIITIVIIIIITAIYWSQSASSRAISVAATHDVILSTLRFIQLPDNPLKSAVFLSSSEMMMMMMATNGGGTTTATTGGVGGGGSKNGRRKYELVTDDLLVNLVLPSFETAFLGREVHRSILQQRLDQSTIDHRSAVITSPPSSTTMTTTTTTTTTGLLGSSPHEGASSSSIAHRSTPELSQSDLLSSLKALSSVRYSDVRNAIILGMKMK